MLKDVEIKHQKEAKLSRALEIAEQAFQMAGFKLIFTSALSMKEKDDKVKLASGWSGDLQEHARSHPCEFITELQEAVVISAQQPIGDIQAKGQAEESAAKAECVGVN